MSSKKKREWRPYSRRQMKRWECKMRRDGVAAEYIKAWRRQAYSDVYRDVGRTS